MNYQHEFFERTAKNFPNLIAVNDNGKKTTYKELDKLSNQLANLLCDSGCEANDRVCILTSKNVNQYAAVLGILKSGSCWIPLSDAFPQKRIEFLLKTLGPKFLIIEEKFYSKISKVLNKRNTRLLIIDKIISKKKGFFSRKDILKKSSKKPLIKNICSSDLAYIIFTSGSTGNPKGVMVTHENTSHFIRNSNVYFKPKKGLKYAHVSELTFDPSIFDMFVCWKNVGTIVPFNRQAYRINPFVYFKENKDVNVVFCVPSLFKKLEDLNKLKSRQLSKLKHLIFTGEKIPDGLPTNIYKSIKDIKIYNLYGATETAILSHWYQIPKNIKSNDEISVGKPIPNFQVFLIKDNKEVSKNKSGYVHVYSPQVSPGYWGNTYLTDLQFIKNPKDNKLPQKIYKLGDMLKKDDNGFYYFLGRSDNQVKIRGHRIELEEVENNIRQIEGINDVVAIAYNRTKKIGNSDLFIFVKSNNSKINKIYINNEIKKNLPTFMLPTDIFILKDDFPRTINGKVDKKELTKKIFKYLS